MIKNICHNCINHERCINYRYNGILPSKVKDYTLEDNVYYIKKCDDFEIRQGFKYYGRIIRD